MKSLRRGDLLPRIVTPPPGPRARTLCRDLARYEAPGVNTLPGGASTMVWQEALGANVLDVEGNVYVDLTAGFGAAAVGHRHPRVVAAIRRQGGVLLHGLGDVAAHPLRIRLARRLARLAPVDDPQVFFAVSGAEAVEIALKTALLATGRPGILAFDPAYHGLTLGALAVTSRREFRAPFQAHLHRRVRRLPYGSPPEAVARVLDEPSGVGCVILEPVVGREGVLLPPPGWLKALARVTKERQVLLVADEIFTGFGRTGSWFAVADEGVRPDLLCCGKALGGGLPIAAVVGRSDLMAAWRTPGEALHTATFLAHPLSCAAALAVLDILRARRLPERARKLGAQVAERVLPWAARYPGVREVRGRGLLWGIELASAGVARKVAAAAGQRGVLVLSGGSRGEVIQLAPPLTIAQRQLLKALELLDEALVAEAAGGP